MKLQLVTVLLLATLSSNAFAATEPQSKQYGDWVATYFSDKDGHKNCFIQSVPQKTEPAGVKRDQTIHFFITHWTGDKTTNGVSISFGYPLKKGSQPIVTIDGKDFKMAKADDAKSADEREMAWTEDQSVDDAITAAIQKGTTLEVSAVSQRGTKTKDIYSLKGSAEAYRESVRECGAP